MPCRKNQFPFEQRRWAWMVLGLPVTLGASYKKTKAGHRQTDISILPFLPFKAPLAAIGDWRVKVKLGYQLFLKISTEDLSLWHFSLTSLIKLRATQQRAHSAKRKLRNKSFGKGEKHLFAFIRGLCNSKLSTQIWKSPAQGLWTGDRSLHREVLADPPMQNFVRNRNELFIASLVGIHQKPYWADPRVTDNRPLKAESFEPLTSNHQASV